MINSGVENFESGIGVYLGSEESYEVFGPLINPIIEMYHGFDPSKDTHRSDWSEINLGEQLDENYCLSTRIRVARNLRGFPLGTFISSIQRQMVE